MWFWVIVNIVYCGDLFKLLELGSEFGYREDIDGTEICQSDGDQLL